MAYAWKIEFYAIGEDGDAFAWEDSLDAAKAHSETVRVDQVTHYSDDTEVVWERDQ